LASQEDVVYVLVVVGHMYCSYKWNRKNKTTTNTWSALSNALLKTGSWLKEAVQAVDVADLPQKGPLGSPTITNIAVGGGKTFVWQLVHLKQFWGDEKSVD
jgi:hydroxylamine reductase (hybrid-cluster protein)